MPNLKQIKNRIKSVKSTGKITQAMKMVAASKVKKAENAAKESRPYSMFLVKMFDELMQSRNKSDIPFEKYDSALENYPALLKKRPIKNVALLVITSDKGLAGGYNANIIREATKVIDDYKEQNIGVKLFVVGLKGIIAMRKICANTDVELVKNYSKIPPIVEVEVANMITEDIAKLFVEEKVDAIRVIFTAYKSMLSYQVTSFQLLPLEHLQEEETTANPVMCFEPNPESVLKKLVPLYISNTVYTTLKEAMASELASRMNAMGNATKNAEEIVKNLSVSYNKARQYAITQEIIEVVAGSNSIKK